MFGCCFHPALQELQQALPGCVVEAFEVLEWDRRSDRDSM